MQASKASGPAVAHRRARLGRRVVAVAATTPAVAAAKPQRHDHHHAPQRSFDVVGVGQALVDMQFTVDDGAGGVLAKLGVERGGRRVVSAAEREGLLEVLSARGNGKSGGVSAGGSLANTLMGLARLGRAAGKPLRVAMGGSVGGDDALGSLARDALRAAGVSEMSPPPPASSSAAACAPRETGTVIVVTTRSDAQRSFLACFPPDASLERENSAAAEAEAVEAEAEAAKAARWAATAAPHAAASTPLPPRGTSPLRAAARDTALLALEGYVLELPGAAEALPALAALARASGARVALAAGDAGVVRRHSAAVAALLRAGVDVLLANAEEAEELLAIVRPPTTIEGGGDTGRASLASDAAAQAAAAPRAETAARELSAACGGALVSVTDGSRGAYIACAGRLAVVPPCWSREAPVDTTGAGDAYAAGLLWSLLSQQQQQQQQQRSSADGPDLHALGAAARRAAAAVIARVGPALTEEDAARVVAAGLAATSAPRVPAAAAAAAPAPARR